MMLRLSASLFQDVISITRMGWLNQPPPVENRVKQISLHDRDNLENEISMDELSKTLKNTRNNVAPGAGGFTGGFYKVFWKNLKNIVLGAVHEIF